MIGDSESNVVKIRSIGEESRLPPHRANRSLPELLVNGAIASRDIHHFVAAVAGRIPRGVKRRLRMITPTL
jgi:hypothetical protein